MANIFNNISASIFTKEPPCPLLINTSPYHTHILYRKVTFGNKATDPLNRLVYQLTLTLVLLLWVSLDQGQLPEDWKIAMTLHIREIDPTPPVLYLTTRGSSDLCCHAVTLSNQNTCT